MAGAQTGWNFDIGASSSMFTSTGPIQFGPFSVNYGNGNTTSNKADQSYTPSDSTVGKSTGQTGIPIATGYAPGYEAAPGGIVAPGGSSQTVVMLAVGAVLLLVLLKHRKG